MRRPHPPINPVGLDSYLHSCGYMPKEMFDVYLPEIALEAELQVTEPAKSPSAPSTESSHSFWSSTFLLMAIATTFLAGTVTLGRATYQLLSIQQPTPHTLGTPAAWKF